MKFIYTASLLVTIIINAFSGWYECYNFNGFISDKPITLSIQIIGRKSTDNKDRRKLDVCGVYKYDKINNPICLAGNIDTISQKVSLMELNQNTGSVFNDFGNKRLNKSSQAALLEFTLKKEQSTGKWVSLKTNASYVMKLMFVSQLVDLYDSVITSNVKPVNKVNVLMRASTKTRYFIGVYEYDYLRYPKNSAIMTTLNIYDKRNNKLFQSIDFDERTGNVMTFIYENVNNVNKDDFCVIAEGNKIGIDLVYHFDSVHKKYILVR